MTSSLPALPRPPRATALVIALLGAILAIGGGFLLVLGGSPYYLIAGAAALLSAWWLWGRDARGWWTYQAIVVATIAWAVLEAGLDLLALAPRVTLILAIGLWLMLPSIRRTLNWKARQGRIDGRLFAGAALAIVAVAVLLAPGVPPPTMAEAMVELPPGRASPLPATESAEWTNVGYDLSGNRFTPAAQITPANVGELKLAWFYRTGDVPEGLFSFENTPLMANGKLFVCTPTSRVIALDAATGRRLWQFAAPADGFESRFHPVCRGVAYHAGADQPSCSRRILTSSPRGELWALDADTGRPCGGFGIGGKVSLLEGMGTTADREWVNTSPGTVVDDMIVIGGKVADNQGINISSGAVRAFDIRTGALIWAWDMGRPDRAGLPPQGETYTKSTPNAWTPFSVDRALSLVYVPLGNPSPDFFGAYRRPFDEQYGSTLVALDLRTGRPRWSRQFVHHDLWGQDPPSQPLLVDWPTAAGARKAVVQLTKTGDIFVLDRATGVPIVPVREMPVSQAGGSPYDRSSPTQPASALSLAPRRLREADMWGLTPIDQLFCRISFQRSRYAGAYTLPGHTQAIGFPLNNGVSNWGGGTVDPRNNLLVMNPTYIPWQTRLLPRAKGDTRVLTTAEDGFAELAGTPYRYRSNRMLSVLEIPCNRPPWGELVGIDMTTGKFAWRRRLGTGRDAGPFGIPSMLPLTIGVPSVGGNIITGGGLSFIGGSQDRYFRAIEVRTGAELWRARLPAGGNATPMSYMAGGRQYVVIAAGGHAYLGSKSGDYVLAYSLGGRTTR